MTNRLNKFWAHCFGIAARRAALDYVVVTGLIMLVLLAIAWAIDLARYLPEIRKGAEASERPLLSILLPYLAYRAADIIIRLIPVACFFGVFMAEILRRLRLQPIVLSTAGLSPIALLGPLIIYTAALGSTMVFLETVGRPQAIIAQVKLGYGSYAHRFGQRWITQKHWFLYDDVAIRGEVYRGTPPAMRDVLVFQGLQKDALDAVYGARLMTSTEVKGEWRLSDVTLWSASSDHAGGKRIDDLTLSLDLIAEELIHFQVSGFYLPNASLHKLAQSHPGLSPKVGADLAIWQRRVVWSVPLVLGALGFLLANSGFVGRQIHVPRLVAFGILGYMAAVSFKVVYAIGEIDGLSPFVATSAPAVAIACFAGVLIWRQS